MSAGPQGNCDWTKRTGTIFSKVVIQDNIEAFTSKLTTHLRCLLFATSGLVRLRHIQDRELIAPPPGGRFRLTMQSQYIGPPEAIRNDVWHIGLLYLALDELSLAAPPSML